MAFNLAVPSSNNYFGPSLTGTNEVSTRPIQTTQTLQMSVLDGKKQQSAYKPVKFVPPKKIGDGLLPKVIAGGKKRKLASASILQVRKSEERLKKLTGMNIVETFLTTQIPDQDTNKAEQEGLSRIMGHGFKSGNITQGKSQTKQKFLKYTNDEIHNKVDDFYRKNNVLDTMNQNIKEEKLQENIKLHRQKVNKKLREFE